MKIRIKGNSVRIRISRPELALFGKEGYLEERTEFGAHTLIYALKNREGIEHLAATFEDGTVTVFIPSEIASEWVTTNVVGYSHNMDVEDGKQLFILVEKDFKCIDAPAYESQEDNFDNPHTHC